MSYRLALVPMALILVTACNSGPKTEADKESWAMADVRIAVKNRLRDPDSAEFGSIHTVNYDGQIIVCGYVNATNGFGGKSGLQRFIGAGDMVFLEEDGADAISESWTKFGC
jgi:hypothetical protein